MKIVRIDGHKSMCQVAVLDEDGNLLDENRFPNTSDGIEEFAGKLTTLRDEVRVVVESTGNLWIQIHDRLARAQLTPKQLWGLRTRLHVSAR